VLNHKIILISLIQILTTLNVSVSQSSPMNGVLFYTKDYFYGQPNGSYYVDLYLHRGDLEGVSEFIIENSTETAEFYKKCGGRYSLIDLVETNNSTQSQLFPYYFKILSINCD
jgi:hypothetical protein